MSRGFGGSFRPARLVSFGLLAALLAACVAGGDPVAEGVIEAPFGTARQALSLDAGADGGLTEDAAAPAERDAGTAAASNDCCSTSGTSGCNDPGVLACVCEGDEFCCSTEYDGVCVTQAQSRCGLACDVRAPESDCCAPSGVPGCTQPEVQACICDIDPFCCIFRFDENCVNVAAARCAGGCAVAEPAP
jgi:hypothetical protein